MFSRITRRSACVKPLPGGQPNSMPASSRIINLPSVPARLPLPSTWSMIVASLSLKSLNFCRLYERLHSYTLLRRMIEPSKPPARLASCIARLCRVNQRVWSQVENTWCASAAGKKSLSNSWINLLRSINNMSLSSSIMSYQ